MVKSLIITLTLVPFLLSGVFAKFGGRYIPVTVDVNNYTLNQPNLLVKVDKEEVVFNAHEGHAIEKVVSDNKVIRTFNLSVEAPKTVVKHLHDTYTIVSINVEPSLNLAYTKKGDQYVVMDITEFYETVFFRGLENVVVDLEKVESSGYFSVSEFGSGQMHEFEITTRRISKLVAGDKDLVAGKDELLLGVVVHIQGEKKVATVWYVYKKDGRIKEIFFQRVNKKWTRVDQKTAAKTLHAINPKFSADYRSIYDGFSVSSVLFSIAAICVIAFYY